MDQQALSARDPEIGLRAVVSLRRLTERMEAIQVTNARRQGWTWAQIAERLGVSKQAAHQKYRHLEEE